MFIALWEFQVEEASRPAFESLYGSSGAWVELFRSDPAYLGSELLVSPEHPGQYLTIDRWESATAYHAFKQQHAAAYAAIDAHGEHMTAREQLLGEFELVTR